MCQFMRVERGYRTYGDNIPGYAQGAYFPGDEPGIYCKISGALCYLEQGFEATPAACEYQEPTGKHCPDCAAPIYRNGEGIVYCPECGEIQ